jgi:hypothetical protein
MRLRIAVAVLPVAVGLLGPLGSVPASARTCTITGTSMFDNIKGTSGHDVICARAGGTESPPGVATTWSSEQEAKTSSMGTAEEMLSAASPALTH